MFWESISDGFYALDRDWRFTYINRHSEKITGRICEEILGKNFWEVFPATIGTSFEKKIRRAVSENSAVTFEEFYPPFDSWFEVRAYPSAAGLSIYFHDITTRKKSEQALRESAHELERQSRIFDTTLSAITDFIYVLDRNGRFVYSNQALLDLLGITAAEIVGRNFYDLNYPPDLAGRLQRQIQNVFESKEKLTDETPFTAPDGQKGFYEYIFSPVFSADGGVELVAGSTRDVTELKRAGSNFTLLSEIQTDFARYLSSKDLMQTAGERIAAHLDLSHCLFVEIDEAADKAEVFYDYHAADVPDLVGVYKLTEFRTPDEMARLKAGKTIVTNDVRDAPRSASAAAEFEALGVRSLVDAPYVSSGRWKFSLAAQHRHPHQWRSHEIELLNTLSERIYLRLERARAEEAVRESEERFRALQQATPDGFMVFESVRDESNEITDFRWVYVNPAATRITGRSPADLLGKHLCVEMPGNRTEGLFDQYVRVVRTGEVWRNEFGYRHENLDHYFVSTAVQVGDGFAVGFSDVSERKRAELSLAFLAEISQDLARLGTVKEIMQTVGAKIGGYFGLSVCNFVEINEAADEAVINFSWHGADSPGSVGTYRIAEFVTGEFQQISRAGETFVVADTQIDRRVNADKYAARQIGSLLSVPFVRDDEWRFLLVVYHTAPHVWRTDEIELLRELTTRIWSRLERARVEETVRDNQQKLNTALEAGRMGSWEVNLKNGKMTASDTCKTNYGRPPESEFTYQDLTDSVYPEDRERRRETIDAAIEQGAEFEIEYRVHWLDNSVHWVLMRGNCFTDESGVTNALAGVSIDITNRREIETEREKMLEREQELRQSAESANRLKDEFLTTLSHELRTPLNAILGWSQMLQTKQLDANEVKKALSTIERNARSQNQLIDDLLDVSRIITGKLRLDVRVVDLSVVISAAVDAARPAAEAKNIRLQTLLDPQAGPISGDPDRLQQVVWNLLSNAVKFTPKNGRVQVRLERVDSHVEIVISDTGKGIEAEFLPHVFDRFRQSDGSMTRRHGGLGLGLAIARQLVELHGGSVSAESSGENEGATFTVDLPLLPMRRETSDDDLRVHPTARKNAAAAADECVAELKGLNILLVDDEADSRELLDLVLDSCGAKVTTAASAAEALDKLQKEKFDVVVSDIGMPLEDGFSLIGKIRNLPDAKGGSTPAIALTAYARAEDRVQALRSGFQMHIAKPVESDELVVAIANLAGRMRNPNLSD